VLARKFERDPARDQQLEARRCCEQLCQLRRDRKHMLEVIQNEQDLTRSQVATQALEQRLPAGCADMQGLGDGGQDVTRVAQRRELGEHDPIRERSMELGGRLQREPGLADAGRSREREQPYVGTREHGTHLHDLALATGERAGWAGQVGRPSDVRPRKRQPVDRQLAARHADEDLTLVGWNGELIGEQFGELARWPAFVQLDLL
jgi:hypothetical protein